MVPGLRQSQTTLLRISSLPRVCNGPGPRLFSSLNRTSTHNPLSKSLRAPRTQVWAASLTIRDYSASSPLHGSSDSAAPSLPTDIEKDVESLPEGLPIPEAVLPDSAILGGLDVQPLQYGDLGALGLTSWTPPGIVRWAFESIHTLTGLPYFWTILATGVLCRLIVLPLTIQAIKSSAGMALIERELADLREAVSATRKHQDPVILGRLIRERDRLFATVGVNPKMVMIWPVSTVPISVGYFLGMQDLFHGGIPQMHMYSGIPFFPDLTAASPYYILPIALTAMVNVQASINAREMNLAQRPLLGHIVTAFRLITLGLCATVMQTFSAGLLISLLFTASAHTLQTYILQKPTIRAKLDIPQIPAHLQAPLPSLVDSWKYAEDAYRFGGTTSRSRPLGAQMHEKPQRRKPSSPKKR